MSLIRESWVQLLLTDISQKCEFPKRSLNQRSTYVMCALWLVESTSYNF
jgi:hypothetical protein